MDQERENTEYSAEAEPQPHIEGISDFSGQSLEELAESYIVRILERISKKPGREKYYRNRYSLDPNTGISEALHSYSEKRIDEYNTNLLRRIEEMRAQTAHCAAIAKEHGYISRQPAVRIVIVDDVLRSPKLNQSLNSFNPDTGNISVSIRSPNAM
jgi:hypothetical protein